MIFVDSNIPMYLVGADGEMRARAQALLEHAVIKREKLLTNAEVMQEILHRYVAIGRRDAIQPALDALLGVVDEVYPVTQDDVQHAKTIVLGHLSLSARDAIHLATMERNTLTRVMSFDTGFDSYPGIDRLH